MSISTSGTGSKLTMALGSLILLVVSGLLGVLSYEFIPQSPSAAFFDLTQRVEEVRSESLSQEESALLDEAAATLDAARRAIKNEGEKAWRVRSYDRARALLWRTELLLDGLTVDETTS